MRIICDCGETVFSADLKAAPYVWLGDDNKPAGTITRSTGISIVVMPRTDAGLVFCMRCKCGIELIAVEKKLDDVPTATAPAGPGSPAGACGGFAASP